jgi:hypothetical protein
MRINPEISMVAITVALLLHGVLLAEDAFVVWQTSPWMPLEPEAQIEESAMMPGAFVPAKSGTDTALPFETSGPAWQALARLAMNEYQAVVLNIRNNGPRTILFSIDEAPLLKAVPGLSIEMRRSFTEPIWQVPEMSLTKTVEDPGEFGKPGRNGEPLYKMGPKRVLAVPGRQVRQVWLILHTKAVKPGLYRGEVPIVPLNRDIPSRPVKFAVRVYPFRLPEHAELGVYNWDYGTDEGALRQMIAHKVNTFMVTCFPYELKADGDGNVSGKLYSADQIRRIEKYCPTARYIGSYGTFEGMVEWARDNGVQYMSDDFVRIFSKTLIYIREYYKKLGIWDRVVLQHVDEVHGGEINWVEDLGPIARNVDPKMRFAISLMSSWDDIRRMAPYTDVWLFRGGRYGDLDFWARQVQRGSTEWMFHVGNVLRGSPPLSANRARPWVAWRIQVIGIASFNYYGAVWRPGSNPVTVRGWEALREGVQDWQYFNLLRKEAKKARIAGHKKEADRAEGLTEEIIYGLLGPYRHSPKVYITNHHVVSHYIYRGRHRVAQEIVKLKKLNGGEQ